MSIIAWIVLGLIAGLAPIGRVPQPLGHRGVSASRSL